MGFVVNQLTLVDFSSWNYISAYSAEVVAVVNLSMIVPRLCVFLLYFVVWLKVQLIVEDELLNVKRSQLLPLPESLDTRTVWNLTHQVFQVVDHAVLSLVGHQPLVVAHTLGRCPVNLGFLHLV